MASRRFLLAAPLLMIAPAALLVLAAPASLRAEDTPDVPNAKFAFIGETNGNVFVRSGPNENYYATSKLEKGQRVKVVGIRYQWLKIEPPEGSFSYLAKMYVDRHGDGKSGRVNNPANVRAGSVLNQMKTTIQTKLDPGAEVKILGDEDEYYKIEPPAGAYVYINQQYVRPVGPPDGVAARPAATDGQATPNPATPGAQVDTATKESADAIALAVTGSAGSASQPAEPAPGKAGTATPPPPSPAPERVSLADSKFEQLENEFAAASQKSVIDQPIPDLLARYQQVTHEEGLPESLKRVADARVAALKVRQEAREQFLSTRKAQDEMRQRNQALQAEREELEEKIKETQVDFYTAVGTLRPSSLQGGPRGTTLYRLTDPQTGRTLVYLRVAGTQAGPLLNQFVGVRGEMQKDPLLRINVIQPTETKAIEQARLGNGIAAAVMPPSLLGKMPTVSNEAQNAPVEGQ